MDHIKRLLLLINYRHPHTVGVSTFCSIVVITLPRIGRDLGSSPSGVWLLAVAWFRYLGIVPGILYVAWVRPWFLIVAYVRGR